MLSSVRLRNFQKHKSLTVEFGPRVTTIVGHTEAGKSTVLRAIEWCLLNKPPRGNFIRHGAKFVKVSVVVNGTKITRYKSKRGNTYQIDNGPKLKAVGRGEPPASVRKIISLDEDNFQGPFDPPFWLTLSAGQVGRNLNSVVDLSIMDSVLGSVASEMRVADQTVKATLTQLKESKALLRTLDWIPACNRLLQRLKRLRREGRETADKCDMARFLAQAVVSLTERQKTAQNAKLKGRKAIQYGEQLAAIEKRIENAKSLITEVKSYKPREIPSIEKLLRIRKTADQVTERCAMAESALESYLKLEREYRTCKAKRNELAKQLIERVGVKCPVCKQKVPKSFSRKIGSG